MHPSDPTAEPHSLTHVAMLAASLLSRLFPNHHCSRNLARRIYGQLELVRLPVAIAHHALYYIARLSRRPAFHAAGHSLARIFTLGLAMADTALDDNAYAAQSWCTVAGERLTVPEWTRMYLDAISALNWQLELAAEAHAAWVKDLDHWWLHDGCYLAPALFLADNKTAPVQSHGMPSPAWTETSELDTTADATTPPPSESRLAGWPWAITTNSVAPTSDACIATSHGYQKGHRKHKLSWPWRWSSQSSF